jgi:hypothetical protein
VYLNGLVKTVFSATLSSCARPNAFLICLVYIDTDVAASASGERAVDGLALARNAIRIDAGALSTGKRLPTAGHDNVHGAVGRVCVSGRSRGQPTTIAVRPGWSVEHGVTVVVYVTTDLGDGYRRNA